MRDSGYDVVAPYLVMCTPAGGYSSWALTLVPMVEVPSGTSGPWVALRESVHGPWVEAARACLDHAMAADAVRGVTTAQRPDSAADVSWHLANTRVMTPVGESFYFSPATVCWCDETGAPRFDCDEYLRPADDMLDAGNVIPPGYAFVADDGDTCGPATTAG